MAQSGDLVGAFFEGYATGDKFYNDMVDNRLQQAMKRVELDGNQMALEDDYIKRRARIENALAGLYNNTSLQNQQRRHRDYLDKLQLVRDQYKLGEDISTSRDNSSLHDTQRMVRDFIGVNPLVDEKRSSIANNIATNNYGVYTANDSLKNAQLTENSRRRTAYNTGLANLGISQAAKAQSQAAAAAAQNGIGDIYLTDRQKYATGASLGKVGYQQAEALRNQTGIDAQKIAIFRDLDLNGISTPEDQAAYLNNLFASDGVSPDTKIAAQQILTEMTKGKMTPEEQVEQQRFVIDPVQFARDQGLTLIPDEQGHLISAKGEVTLANGEKLTIPELQLRLAYQKGYNPEPYERPAFEAFKARQKSAYGVGGTNIVIGGFPQRSSQ